MFDSTARHSLRSRPHSTHAVFQQVRTSLLVTPRGPVYAEDKHWTVQLQPCRRPGSTRLLYLHVWYTYVVASFTHYYRDEFGDDSLMPPRGQIAWGRFGRHWQ